MDIAPVSQSEFEPGELYSSGDHHGFHDNWESSERRQSNNGAIQAALGQNLRQGAQRYPKNATDSHLVEAGDEPLDDSAAVDLMLAEYV